MSVRRAAFTGASVKVVVVVRVVVMESTVVVVVVLVGVVRVRATGMVSVSLLRMVLRDVTKNVFTITSNGVGMVVVVERVKVTVLVVLVVVALRPKMVVIGGRSWVKVSVRLVKKVLVVVVRKSVRVTPKVLVVKV